MSPAFWWVLYAAVVIGLAVTLCVLFAWGNRRDAELKAAKDRHPSGQIPDYVPERWL